MLKRKNGQSVLEYVVILSAVVAAVVFFAGSSFKKDDSSKNSGLGKFLYKSASSITSAAEAITANWK